MRDDAAAGWLHSELLLGITWYSVLMSLLALGLVALSALATRLLLRHLAHRPPERLPPAAQPALRAAGAPLLLAIWGYGTAVALTPLLEHLARPDGSNPALAVAWLVARASVVAGVLWLCVRLTVHFNRRLEQWAQAQTGSFDRFVIPLLARSLPVALPIIALFLSLPLLALPTRWESFAANGAAVLLIVAVAWTLVQLAGTAEKLVLHRFRVDVADNLRARSVHTQVSVLRKVLVVLILVFAAASVLMVFETMRQFGTSLLASAGIAGLVLGFAAQRVLGNILAGFQIALTQPIRLDDAIVVEGEWGWVEELTLTYAVVRLWDLRRLVLPITYFIEHPFQNWTRTSASLIGSVYLYLDYATPMEALRAELLRLCEQHADLWDGKVCALQVTDTREHVIEVRALASAASGGAAWELRCRIREQLIAFLHRNYPDSLPTWRTLLRNGRPDGPTLRGAAGDQPGRA
jgi:small-conductance mechanosensitive channel